MKNLMNSQNEVSKKSDDLLKSNMHSATQYVQNAVEGAVRNNQDATQNLVNNVMNKQIKDHNKRNN